ncbi:Ricin-type beta-trefoil lectin domain-containing protein [Lentzea albidocapillata subsp. violacea]|uniref:Ricin-type beta-trefoil lectin domain-containing protein n=1 Tax=Lentzea albidocapillata subsp. violacea TaxID=128104 RepID=A0A1G8S190_9PSEU|nr:RICIN domain-containing protein [Lentzea albidocapillata]SDJ22998.1 Ricin-type beta-trefoil lectin domain-containing protein [Lentzea albidocapillata subsp. violacea]
MTTRNKLIGAVSAVLALATLLVVVPQANADGPFRIRNFGSNKCIQPHPGNPFGNDSPVVQLPCNTNNIQKWTFTTNVKGTLSVVNLASGKCLNVSNNSTLRSPVVQFTCNTNSNQRWVPPTPRPNTVPKFFYSKVSGDTTCLDAKGDSSDFVQMQIYLCQDDHPFTLWFVDAA